MKTVSLKFFFIMLLANYTYTQTKSTMQPLLKQVSTKAIALGELEYTSVQIAKSWIGFQPASKEGIAAVEKRLKVVLPDDYKQFLLLTNGFSPAYGVDPSFAPVDSMEYLSKADPELIEIWGRYSPKAYMDKMKRAIKVGGFGEEQYFFLVPPAQTTGKWEYWVFAAWIPGEQVYHSLHEYFEDVLKTIESFEKHPHK